MRRNGCLLTLNSYFVLPAVIFFTVVWFLFGSLSSSDMKYWAILVLCLSYIFISIILGFKYVYNFAESSSNSKDKRIFLIGIILLIFALIAFFKFYLKK